jgi:phosphoserine phosphatase
MTARFLPPWRDGDPRDSILAFLDRVDEIPPIDRVAVFDNDGTMWCEKPNYTQLEFMLVELKAAIAADPSLADKEEFSALVNGDMAAVGEMGLERVVFALVDLHTGLTPEDFNARVAAFFEQARHPDRGVPYRQQRYQPMLELMDELRSCGFDFYIVSGGGAEFVRVIGDDFYSVKPEGVVGSQVAYELTQNDDGSTYLVRTGDIVGSGPNEGAAKPRNIQRILGRRPVVAGGNSAGDAEMLEYAMSYDGPSLAIIVDHDDDQREYSTERKAGTFVADESILETAARLNWVVASNKNDWSTVFPDS